MSEVNGESDESHGTGGRWWPLLAAIPVLFVAWVSLSATSLTLAPFLPVQVTGFLVRIQGAFVAVSYVLSLFAPFVVYHDRRYVAARSRWTPSKWYYLAVLPLVNVPVTSLYLWRRHQCVGTP